MKSDLRILIGLLLLAATVWLLLRLAPVITPFAAAAAIAYLGDPWVDRLEKVRIRNWSMGRSLAVTLVFLLLFGLMLLALLILLPLLIKQTRELVERIPRLIDWFTLTALPWVEAQFGFSLPEWDSKQLVDAIKTYWRELAGASVSIIGSLSAGGQAVINWLLNFVLIPVVTFYLLRDWDALVDGVRGLVPRSAEPTVSRLAREIDEILGAFIRGQLMVMLALGTIYTIGLMVIGLDLAVLIGMTAGLLSIVPYLGTIVGLGAALVAAFAQYQDWLHPLLALGVFGLGQMLEGMVLTPRLVGDKVGLHPVLVIFAVLAGGQLFGFLGILLALPVVSALSVLVRYAIQRYRGSRLYQDVVPTEVLD